MARRSARRPQKPGRNRLNASLAGVEPAGVFVPTRWVKAVVGLFLLPVSYVLTAAFFSALTQATLQEFYRTKEFLCFAAGAGAWLVAYFVMPWRVTLYVFGHELTHAVVVLLMGGKVSAMSVRRDGGHIIASKINTWIALAPYFVPIYSVIAVAIYGIASCFWEVSPYLPALYVALGFTWTFHITFTLAMIPKGQTDLTYGGNFFSLLVIYVMNLLVMSALVILAMPGQGGFAHFVQDILIFARALAVDIARAAEMVLRAIRG